MQAFFSKSHLFLKFKHVSFCLGHEGEMVKKSQISQEHLRAELEEAKVSLRKTEVRLAYSFLV